MFDEASCSDCKLEIIESRWTQLLLNWLNKCVIPNDVDRLNLISLVDIINKYKEEICLDDIDKVILCTDNVEPFIEYKFPILRLRNLCEAKDYPKKLYIMTSILLFYCCIKSQTGLVDADICKNLDEDEQIMILKFCEALSEMEATVNNVESAIKAAYETSQKQALVLYQKGQKIITSDDSDLLTERSVSLVSKKMDSIKEIKRTVLQFKSSITVLPSVIADPSISRSSCEEFSDLSDFRVSYGRTQVDPFAVAYSDSNDTSDTARECIADCGHEEMARRNNTDSIDTADISRRCIQNYSYEETGRRNPVSCEPSSDHQCQSDCACIRCSTSGTCCDKTGCTKSVSDDKPPKKQSKKYFKWTNWKLYAIIIGFLLLLLIVILSTIPLWKKKTTYPQILRAKKFSEEESQNLPVWAWQCKNGFCQKVYHPLTNVSMYTSLSRCTLLCMGPQIWPYPIGYTYFSKNIVALSTNKLEYKFQSVPSDAVHEYLAEAFKLFLKDLRRLEKIDTKSRNNTEDFITKKMVVQIDVENDPDPRLRLNTEESYMLKVETNKNQVIIKVSSTSFCGVRHGLETLSQLILLDQSTGYLISLSNMVVKDAPTYKYRGIMIDTGRNFIPVIDLIRTIDAMATVKLNTFHWRISDVTSFPLNLKRIPEFFEYGPYDRSMVYTKQDVKSVVKRAGIRGIRVLIEVAAPGPVGRPWSWIPQASCPRKNDNFTCNNVLCLRLSMHDSVFDILQTIYAEILEITNVDDIFHLSDGVFSFTNCYYLIDDREGFLDKALVRLKMANKGFLPKLPIIWYTSHLSRDFEAKTWERLGVQLNDWNPNPSDQYFNKFKVIHSSKWDLSCEMRKQRCTKYRTWQQMYAWKSWRNVEVFTIEGGESVLWTDLVDSNNLDYHLWPRAAAVAERLWSDMVVNSSANKYVYLRLDTHRWRMLLRGVKVQPIWPAWCSFNPSVCLEKVH